MYSKHNDWSECIQSIMTGHDVDNIEEFESVFEEVGEIVNIPDNIDEVQDNDDILAPHCDNDFKKVHKLSLVDISEKGKEKLIEDKVTELRLNKKNRLERTDH